MLRHFFQSLNAADVSRPFHAFHKRIGDGTDPPLVVFKTFCLTVFVIFYNRLHQPIGKISALNPLHLSPQKLLHFFQSLSFTGATTHHETRKIGHAHYARTCVQNQLFLHQIQVNQTRLVIVKNCRNHARQVTVIGCHSANSPRQLEVFGLLSEHIFSQNGRQRCLFSENKGRNFLRLVITKIFFG